MSAKVGCTEQGKQGTVRVFVGLIVTWHCQASLKCLPQCMWNRQAHIVALGCMPSALTTCQCNYKSSDTMPSQCFLLHGPRLTFTSATLHQHSTGFKHYRLSGLECTKRFDKEYEYQQLNLVFIHSCLRLSKFRQLQHLEALYYHLNYCDRSLHQNFKGLVQFRPFLIVLSSAQNCIKLLLTMEAQINTNKANLSNKVLLYFCHPLKHTSYNLWGECLDLWSESFKSSAPLSSLFAVLRNSLILPHQWCSTEKSRPLHCQSLRVPVLFDNVFCGSLDSPPFLLFFPPLHALSLFASSIILLTRFRVFLRCLAGGWRGILRSGMKGGQRSLSLV